MITGRRLGVVQEMSIQRGRAAVSPRPRPDRWILVVISLLGMTACASVEPRFRRGSLPYPGFLTFYALASPDHLGTHRYERWPQLRNRECGHGIVYTQRAGFLDMAHIRMSVDWTRYIAATLDAAFRARERTVVLPRQDDSTFSMTFTYPSDWEDCISRGIASELALRIAERTTLQIMLWHEMLTWFGYGTTFIVSEKPSAFTYDDLTSHSVGVAVADAALRNPTKSFDDDVTTKLNDSLRELEVVPVTQAARAVMAVRGAWWNEERGCIKRMVDIGEAGGTIRPWVVKGFAVGSPNVAEFPVPDISVVEGRNFAAFYVTSVTVGKRVPRALRDLSDRSTIDVTADFPRLLEKIRFEIKSEIGVRATDDPNDEEGEP